MHELYEPFLRQLRQDLRGPLPGRSMQHQMAPRSRPGGKFDDAPRPDARRGGVLILLYPHSDPEDAQIYLPLILRPDYPGVHSGQIGLPGGGQEPADRDLTDTALRETYEEIGVHSSQYTVLGQLTPLYVSASNYIVQPSVAWIDYRPEFHIDPYEVAALIEASLRTLLDPATRRVEPWKLRGREIEVPYFALGEHLVWGATAMMLSELLALPAMQFAPR
jgi:8-oxo-dGTP pyrophosphatase MutT (NUDIX family)